MDLRAVHVFPSHVEDPAVGEHPRRVVVLQVGRELTDVLAVGVAAIDVGHLRQPALTQRRARAETNTMPPSGRQHGSMSS